MPFSCLPVTKSNCAVAWPLSSEFSAGAKPRPFFVTACDYVLIGEEFYAASAYLSGSPEMIGSIKGQDYVKLFCMLFILLVVIVSIFNYLNFLSIDISNIFKINIMDGLK